MISILIMAETELGVVEFAWIFLFFDCEFACDEYLIDIHACLPIFMGFPETNEQETMNMSAGTHNMDVICRRVFVDVDMDL